MKKKRAHNEHGPSHVTPAGRGVFYDLGFDEAEARVLEMRALEPVPPLPGPPPTPAFPSPPPPHAVISRSSHPTNAAATCGRHRQSWPAPAA